jgi:hypothetical protein
MAVMIPHPVSSVLRHVPREVLTMVGFAIAIFGVVATGSAISAGISTPSPWLFAAAYGGPAALAFGVYWAISRQL